MNDNQSAEGPAPRQVAIVGLNRETAELLPGLLEAPGIQVIKILNPEIEDLSRLTLYPHLEVIIDTTHSESTSLRLRRLPLRKVDVISGLGARLLFCSLKAPSIVPGGGSRDRIVRSLKEVREAVSAGRGRTETLKAILGTAVKAIGADTASMMLLDTTRKQLTIETAVGLDDQVVLSAVQRVGHGVSGTVLGRREALLLIGPADKAAYSTDYDNPGIVSSICCPILYDDDALGVINITSRSITRVFDSGDVAYVEDLARITADVIRNARTSRESESGQSSIQAPGLLNAVREILSMPYRLEERLNLLLMKLANAFGANLCNYYEYCPEDGLFVARASSAAGVNLLKEKPKFLDDFFAQRALKTDNTFCVNAAGKGPRDKKWYMIQPIRNGQDLAGVLFVHLHSEKNVLREETILIRRVGDVLSREVGRNKEMEAVKIQSLKHSAISQFAYDISAAATLPELAKMILSNVRIILEADTCVLRLRNGADDELSVFQTLSQKNPAWLKDILALDEMVVADLSPGRGAALFPDMRESPYSVEMLGSETALVAALEIGGEVLGTLSLYDKKSADLAGSRSYSEADREVILNFARQAASGLKRFHPFPAPVSWQPVPVPVD